MLSDVCSRSTCCYTWWRMKRFRAVWQFEEFFFLQQQQLETLFLPYYYYYLWDVVDLLSVGKMRNKLIYSKVQCVHQRSAGAVVSRWNGPLTVRPFVHRWRSMNYLYLYNIMRATYSTTIIFKYVFLQFIFTLFFYCNFLLNDSLKKDGRLFFFSSLYYFILFYDSFQTFIQPWRRRNAIRPFGEPWNRLHKTRLLEHQQQ